eukprot:134464-Pleurochrysis_carterae.AAC.1
MTRARDASRRASTASAACRDGPPPVYRSATVAPRGPARPNSAAQRATASEAVPRSPTSAMSVVRKPPPPVRHTQ